MEIREAIDRQRRIFDALQERLESATEDHFADAELLSDLSGAVSYAADALAQMLYCEEQLPTTPVGPPFFGWVRR